MFPVTGDGCFYVGLGGNGQFPKNNFEPYQCCPSSKPSGRSKVAKLPSSTKQVATKATTKQAKQAPEKPFTMARKDAKVVKRPPPQQAATKPQKETAKDNKGKEKQDKQAGKGKKGFFGTGKYIWWW